MTLLAVQLGVARLLGYGAPLPLPYLIVTDMQQMSLSFSSSEQFLLANVCLLSGIL